jgi:hypothetical protein
LQWVVAKVVVAPVLTEVAEWAATVDSDVISE